MESPPLGKRLAAELVGTFGFFFIGFTSIAAGAPGPIGFGFGLFLMIAALGHISGGHYNPAVTVGLTVGRKHPSNEAVQYIVAQIIGGVVAALLAGVMFDGLNKFARESMVTKPGAGVSDFKAMLVELIATLLFLMVISAVATDKSAPWNGIQAPIFIGLFIFTAATVFGPISGGSFNPAVSIAPAIVAGSFGNLWIYLVGPFVGGAIGGGLYMWFRHA
jgi:MIP family channel proteins